MTAFSYGPEQEISRLVSMSPHEQRLPLRTKRTPAHVSGSSGTGVMYTPCGQARLKLALGKSARVHLGKLEQWFSQIGTQSQLRDCSIRKDHGGMQLFNLLM